MRPGPDATDEGGPADGLRRQRALVTAAVVAGAVQCGWKAGFGAPAARERFGLDAPLVGALLDRTRLDAGAAVSIGGWRDARAEAELAVLLGEDVPGDATPARASAAAVALAPAIELVDLDPVPGSAAEALAGNLFHRHWVTGEFRELPSDHDLTGLVAHVTAMGEDLGRIHDLEALTGRAADVLVEVARVGAQWGRGLLRGDVVILGAVVPPAPVAPGGGFRFTLGDHPPLALDLTL